MKRTKVFAALAAASLAVLASAVPANASSDDPPPSTSDDCTLVWVTVDPAGELGYFGDARLNCPVAADLGFRWELDGREIERGYDGKRGPGEVAVFDDIAVSGQPGQELCFIPQAWFNDKGRACLTI